MKVRESGMSEAAYWETLFNLPLILDRLGVAFTQDRPVLLVELIQLCCIRIRDARSRTGRT